jgi:hypothetical protein
LTFGWLIWKEQNKRIFEHRHQCCSWPHSWAFFSGENQRWLPERNVGSRVSLLPTWAKLTCTTTTVNKQASVDFFKKTPTKVTLADENLHVPCSVRPPSSTPLMMIWSRLRKTINGSKEGGSTAGEHKLIDATSP